MWAGLEVFGRMGLAFEPAKGCHIRRHCPAESLFVFGAM